MSDTQKKRGRPAKQMTTSVDFSPTATIKVSEPSTLEKIAKHQDEVSQPVISEQSEEKVTVKKESLDKLLSKVQEMEERISNYDKIMSGVTSIRRGEWEETEQKQMQRTATIKKWRPDTESPWKYIIDWHYLRRERFENDWVDIYKMTLMDEQGNMSFKEFTLSQWAKVADHDIVKLLTLKEKILERVVGDTRLMNLVEDSSRISGYRPEIGKRIKMKVTRAERFWDIEFPNGYQMLINENRLNQ